MRIKLIVIAILMIPSGVMLGFLLYPPPVSQPSITYVETPSLVVLRYFELARQEKPLLEPPISREAYSAELLAELRKFESHLKFSDKAGKIKDFEKLLRHFSIEDIRIQKQNIDGNKAGVITQMFLTNGERCEVEFELVKNLPDWKINNIFLIDERLNSEPRA
jgi:hypothetical protein